MDAMIGALVRSHSALRCLLRALELYDGGQSFAHSWRVGRGVVRIAGRVEWERALTERIVVAGLLHDIGKIFVRREVIMKPAALDSEERAEIRAHPRYGFEVVRTIDEDIAQLLVAHHECAWQPAGEERRNYPRAAERRARTDRRRIARALWRERRQDERRADDVALRPYRMAIAVADVIDALTSERWYKPAMPDPYIRQAAHVHFPMIPDVIDGIMDGREALQMPVPELRTWLP